MKSIPHVLFALATSAVIGVMAAWPLGSAEAVGMAFAATGFLTISIVVFLIILPNRWSMPKNVFIAMIAGVLTGWAANYIGAAAFISDYLGIFGTLFILLLKVVVFPLVFVSVLCGVAGIGDIRKLGTLGTKAMAYFATTAGIAVLIGLFLVNTIQPGKGRESLQSEVAAAKSDEKEISLGQKIQTIMLPAVISDPFLAGKDPIAIIFVALLMGAAMAALGSEAAAALTFFQALDKVFTAIIMGVMYLAPLCVFALMARVIAELGIDYIITLAKYCATVIIGLIIHFCLLTCVIAPLLGRVSPKRFYRAMAPAFEVAFSTSSSAATLPVTLNCVSKGLGIDRNIVGFVLPVGTTVNMNGTALYVTVASIFITQVYALNLTLEQQFLVFLTAVLVSVGTAGIPGASLGLISVILISIDVPVEGIAMVAGVDRLLDMCRTVVNVTDDAVAAIVLARTEGLGAKQEESV
jgi:Na+/H+-dicarboxylate symporter